jgi:hypothetical protein
MNLNNIIRKIISLLSFWYINKKILLSKDLILRKEIIKKINNKNINIKLLKKTHLNFNQKIFLLLKSNKLKSFLRESFIQKMFFLHNRLFIYWELKQLKKDKKWKFYKTLLAEDHIGDPVRYFLYPQSSGNRINHVFHLKILSDELNIILKKDIKKVFEFGSGYGCMARIFSKIRKNINYNCFDTFHVNLLQYYYLKHNYLDVGFTKNKKIFLTSDLIKKGNFDLFIANWSLSETPIFFRGKFISTILRSKIILICFQEKFEDIDNLKYFNNLKNKLSNKFNIRIIENKFYKGNIFFKQKHYFFIGKKL